MDLITIFGIVAIVAAIILLFWMKSYYSKEIDRLKGEVKLFKNTNENQDEAVVVFSANYEIFSANRSARRLLQLDPYEENMVPKNEIFLKVRNSDEQSFKEVIEKQGKVNKGSVHLEKVTLRVGKTTNHVNIHIDHSEWNSNNSIICIFQDAGTEVKEEDLEKKAGEVDFLTNIPSQFKANTDINRMVILAQRDSKKLAFFIFGIDDFEKIKVTYGLSYSNNLLRKFGEFLKELESENSFSYRLDCDSFLYMINDIKDEDSAVAKGKEISSNISQFFKHSSKDTHLKFSTGLVMFPDHGQNASKIIDHAFVALAESREKESGNVQVFKRSQANIKADEKIIAQEMQTGLEKGEFEVYYQPIVDLKTLEVQGAEALIRWKHPRLGLLAPAKFIHLAELSGLIMDIGEFVLEEVIKQHKRWSGLGFKDIEISINISARELLNYELGEKLEQLFIDNKVDPRFFNLDMSERDAMEDAIKTDYEFSVLKKIGVHLSIDHFGVGGSSIEQLQKLPIHTLKIDRSILHQIDKNEDRQETVKAIVVLAHALGLEVVAEGIETKDQYPILQKLGCDRAQGYIFSKPAPAFEFQELIRQDSIEG